MTAITLRNIPPKLQEAIRQRAGKDGLSLNKTVLRMLEEAAGERTPNRRELHHDLDHLAGTWSDQEAAAFDAALVEQRKVDPELWE
jgi:plasmid stability protein